MSSQLRGNKRVVETKRGGGGDFTKSVRLRIAASSAAHLAFCVGLFVCLSSGDHEFGRLQTYKALWTSMV